MTARCSNSQTQVINDAQRDMAGRYFTASINILSNKLLIRFFFSVIFPFGRPFAKSITAGIAGVFA